ncbi:MAG: hypothetical protein LBH37_04345 [Oscillospiraceae bacterium]|nr:hypothetical protein [Oscillospiraceae bacterium]
MMSNNVDEIANFDKLVNEYDINFRINIYKPVSTKAYCLSYEKFWYGIKSLLSKMKLISCSEPIVCAVLEIEDSRSNCGCGKRSIRITPSGVVLPCVYWNKSDLNVDKLNLLTPNTIYKEMGIYDISYRPVMTDLKEYKLDTDSENFAIESLIKCFDYFLDKK